MSETKHVAYGGSSMGRTLQCPAWQVRRHQIPSFNSGSPAADRGTLLHLASEQHYDLDLTFDDMLGEVSYKAFTLEEEHRYALMTAWNAMDVVLDKFDIEEFLLEPYVEVDTQTAGSIDMLGLSSDKETVFVGDWKFGYNPVKVKDNVQLTFYALAASMDPGTKHFFKKAKRIIICVIQPEVSQEAMYQEIHLIDLKVLDAKIKKAKKSTHIVQPGPECRYCPAAVVCPEQKQKAISALALDPSTAEEVAEALELAYELDDWIKNVKANGYSIAKNGGVIPKFKLVEGRSLRRWKLGADDDVVKILGDDAYVNKLVSPAQAEKLTKTDLKPFMEKPPGKPTLVPESDRRAAISEVILPENLTKGFTS